MANVVKRSEVGDKAAFAARVTAYAGEMKAWVEHNALVGEGKADPFPPPGEHPAVMDSVVVDLEQQPPFVVSENYEWVDDSPTAVQILAEKKAVLHAHVVSMQSAASERVWPARKRPLARIMRAEAVARAKVTEDGLVPASSADAAVIHAFDAKTAAIARIDREAAVMLDEIEDLTTETVDAWRSRSLGEPA